VTALAITAGVAIAALAFALYAQGRQMVALARQHDRRVDLLLDRLAHAEGRTWTPPPAALELAAPAVDDELELLDDDELLFQER